MGLLDSVLGAAGAALSGQAGQTGATPDLLHAALGMISNDGSGGGLAALVQRFEQGGLGHVVSSWISSGQNLPISADQLQSVLGSDAVSALAAKLGMSPADVSTHLTQVLPQVVDKLTPQGQIPEGGAGNLADLIGHFMRP